MAVEALRARAPYACDPHRSRGRLHREPPSLTRSDFRVPRYATVSLTAGSTVASPDHILTNNAFIHGASGVTLTGYTASPDSLARVLQRLSVVTSLTDVKLTTTQRTTVGKKDMFQFTITANIATSGGAS